MRAERVRAVVDRVWDWEMARARLDGILWWFGRTNGERGGRKVPGVVNGGVNWCAKDREVIGIGGRHVWSIWATERRLMHAPRGWCNTVHLTLASRLSGPQ